MIEYKRGSGCGAVVGEGIVSSTEGDEGGFWTGELGIVGYEKSGRSAGGKYREYNLTQWFGTRLWRWKSLPCVQKWWCLIACVFLGVRN